MPKREDLEKQFKSTISQSEISEGFIKVTDNPVKGLTAEQKVILNRKANIMYNQGNINDARRIFITTGYSDGLTRVGNYYMNKNESLNALKAYYLAHNNRDSKPIYENIAKVISMIIKEEI